MNNQQRGEVGPVVFVSGFPDEDAESVEALLQAGYDIHTLGEPRRVLSLKEMKPRGWMPAIFLVDTSIPKSSGFELVRQLSNLYDMKKVTLVMISKYKSHEDALEANTAGARGLLMKPITPKVLDDFVEKEKIRKQREQIAGQIIG